MPFWDGERWVSDLTPATTPRRSGWSNTIANLLTVIVAISLLIPFTASLALGPAGPKIDVTPATGPAGSKATIVGSNFMARSKVQLTWDGQIQKLPIANVNNRGAFTVTITVPKATEGSHTLGTMMAEGKGSKALRQAALDTATTIATASFTVVDAPAEPTPTADPTAPPATPAPTPRPTATPDPTATPEPTATATPAPTPKPTPAPTATPAPTRTPAPTPTPAPTSPGLTRSGPITVTADNVTIDAVSISSASQTGSAIKAIGTWSNPIRNLTIRNCVISGFNIGIEARHVENLVVEGCTISDADYAGIAIYSGVGGRLSHNSIRRIGYTRTDFSVSYKQNNAYGITLDRSSYNTTFTTDPRSSDFLVDSNLIEDVPLWMCLNTHAGQRITFSNNTTRRCPRAIFVAGDSGPQTNHPIDVTITGNHLESAVTKPGGTDDVVAILISTLDGGSIHDNVVSASFGRTPVKDYLGQSVGVEITNNQVVVP